ncbi:unnamed protein product [Ectocarpus fasciculatus]
MPSTHFDVTPVTVATKFRRGLSSRNTEVLYGGGGPVAANTNGGPDNQDAVKSLKTALAVQKFATTWHHKVTPSRRLKKHAQRGLLVERPIGETLTKAVGLVDASVAHQRRIRNLFSELEAKERTIEQMDNNGEEEVPAVVQMAWHESRTQEIRVSKKMNELRDDADCDNAIAPVRAIQQMEAYLLSGVAVLKSYMTTGARITATEILSLMSQVTFAAHTAEALSRWAGEAMETLGRERDRAHALHRENAQVSREATLAQKEIMSLEARIFHTRKELESAKAYAARIKAESGDMRAVFGAIDDSVTAAGLELVTHDASGEPLSATQAAFAMIKKLRETCISQQDHIGRLEFFVERGKLDLEQAEMTIKGMERASSSKRARKRAAATAAAKTKSKRGAYGSSPSNGGSGGGSRAGGRPSSPTQGNKASSSSIGVSTTTSMTSSDLQSAARAPSGGRYSGTRGGSPSSSSYNTATNDDDAATFTSTDAGQSTATSSSTAADSSRAGMRASPRAARAGAGADRDGTAVSVSASTTVDSYSSNNNNNNNNATDRVGGRGGRVGRRATNTETAVGGGGGNATNGGRRRRTQAVVAEGEGAGGESGGGGGAASRGERHRGSVSPSSAATTPRGHSRGGSVSSPPTGSSRRAPDESGDTRQEPPPPLREEESGTGQGEEKQQHPEPPAGDDAGVMKIPEETKAEEEEEEEQEEEERGNTQRITKPAGEKSPGKEHASAVVTKKDLVASSALGSAREDRTPEQQQQEQQVVVKASPRGQDTANAAEKKDGGGKGENGEEEAPRRRNDRNAAGSVDGASPTTTGAAPPEALGEEEREQEDQGEEHDGSAEDSPPPSDADVGGGSLGEGAAGTVAPTVERANRRAVKAMRGLEDEMKNRLSSLPGLDAAAREHLHWPQYRCTCLHSVRCSQVLSLKDTIWRDMREVAEEASATAGTESMRMMTELAKRDARITQLGSRIEDLQTRLVKINEAHEAGLGSLNKEAAAEVRSARPEHREESESTPPVQQPPLNAQQQQQEQQQQQQHFFDPELEQEPRVVADDTTTEWDEEQQHHHYQHGHGTDGSTRRQGWGERDGPERDELQNHQHGGATSRDEHRHHQHAAGSTAAGRRDGGPEGGIPAAQVGGVVGGVQSPSPTRTPVDGGDEKDAHWEGSTGIGLLRRGKSAGTFLLQQQQQQQQQQLHSVFSPERGGGGGDAGKRHSRNDGVPDSPSRKNGRGLFRSPSGRTTEGEGVHFGDESSSNKFPALGGRAEEDQQTVSVLTADTSFTQNLNTGMTTPPLGQQQRVPRGGGRGGGGGQRQGHRRGVDNRDSPQRQEHEPTGGSGAKGGDWVVSGREGGGHAPPPASSGNAGEKRQRHQQEKAQQQHRHDGGAGGSPDNLGDDGGGGGGSPAPAASVKDMQGRARLQHMPKTVGDVVLAVAGGGVDESPEMVVTGAVAAKAAVAERDAAEKEADGVRKEPEGVEGGGTGEAAAGDEADGEEDRKRQRQQRALQAFLKGADDTQANLAFVALRQEPYIVEEFGYLAKQIRDLHEATNGAVPRHISHRELRDRFRELSARSAPLLRRVRARYRRLHARWASTLLQSLSTRGLNAGDADISLTCSLCGYDWRNAQPRGYHRRPAFHGMKRGNTPGRVRGLPPCSYLQDRRTRPEKKDGDGPLSKRDIAQRQGLVAPSGGGAVVVPGVFEGWKAEEGDGSSLQVASGGRGETANTSLLSEQALLLHSLSTPNMSGVGAAGLFGGGGGAGAFGGSGGEHGGGGESSTGPPSLLSKAGGREAEGQNGGTTGVRGSGDTLLPPLLLPA